MNVEEAIYEGNDKFMWDGEVYDSLAAAQNVGKTYEEKGFQVRIFEKEGKHLVYTRRVVTEIVIEGTPQA